MTRARMLAHSYFRALKSISLQLSTETSELIMLETTIHFKIVKNCQNSLQIDCAIMLATLIVKRDAEAITANGESTWRAREMRAFAERNHTVFN
jgi:hypothetical protein